MHFVSKTDKKKVLVLAYELGTVHALSDSPMMTGKDIAQHFKLTGIRLAEYSVLKSVYTAGRFHVTDCL